MKKKILTIWIAAALAMTSFMPVSKAEIILFPEESAGNQAICRGGRDWGTFISAIISYDDFAEYWKDILVRYSSNICHYQDIDSLLTRITAVREQIRRAFYVCADTTRMKQTYYELEAELFYLRTYINTDYSGFTVVDDQKVISDLRNYFVINKAFFTDQQILDLFNRFKTKYTPRLVAYQNCTDPVWQNLVDKWNEFKSSAGGITPALNAAKQSAEKRWDRMANTSLNLGRDFWGGFLDVRINKLPAKEGLNQILDELNRNTPGGGVTFDQLQAATSVSDTNYNYEADEATYLAQYQMLYLETSDAFTGEITARLNTMNSIVNNSFKYQNQTIQCVKSINSKQC
jgi:hypothetical protein